MKKIIFTLAAVVMLLAFSSCGTNVEKKVLANQQDSLSWAMGMSLARTAKSGFYEFDENLIRQAFESSLKGQKQPLSEEAYMAACEQITFLATQGMVQQNNAESKDAAEKEDQFFQKLLKDNPNIKQAEQGFYYEVLRPGKGPLAQENKRLRFDFRGMNMLTNEVIDETYGHRDPIVHNLSRSMFPGIFYGFQLMNAGSQFRFYFPHKLVTGAKGIPTNTPVIYEVELHEIYND